MMKMHVPSPMILSFAKDVGDFKLGLEDFAQSTLINKSFNVKLFAGLMNAIDFSADDLYRSYIAKNVLNFFRQDFGYKEGSYQKNWAGKEDNEHLVEIVAALDVNSEQFKDDIYSALKERYESLCAMPAS